jgi:hypothetical protein
MNMHTRVFAELLLYDSQLRLTIQLGDESDTRILRQAVNIAVVNEKPEVIITKLRALANWIKEHSPG